MTVLKIRNPETRFEIVGDKDHFNLIVEDMRSNAGSLAPSDHWNWNLGEGDNVRNGYTDDLYEAKYSQLSTMLDPWVGVTGMQALAKEAVDKYENFLRPIDHLQYLPIDILTHGRANGWRETDLGSVLDISLITIFSANNSKEKTCICEVGGGYGRLAEIFLGEFKERVHYVMVDAVPGSLMYAYYYIKSQFPDLNIGSFYAGDKYNIEYDCYIIPSWHTGLLQNGMFDICINIESMQEMQQQHVDFYFQLFDRLAVNDSVIYLSNARDYVFKGVWNVPSHWETVYLNNTPRSWSADHPTHILRKKTENYSLARKAHECAYSQQIEAWNNNQLCKEQKLHIADRDRICGELQQTIDGFKVGDDCQTKFGFLQRLKNAVNR